MSGRPVSADLIDLHVYVVPPDLWQERLRSAVNQIIAETISAGFVRVYPETLLCNLREEVDRQLGFDLVPRDFVYCKSVGRCLAQVRSKQETQMKVKHFAPPHAYCPEIFVLDADTARRSQLSSNGSRNSNERNGFGSRDGYRRGSVSYDDDESIVTDDEVRPNSHLSASRDTNVEPQISPTPSPRINKLHKTPRLDPEKSFLSSSSQVKRTNELRQSEKYDAVEDSAGSPRRLSNVHRDKSSSHLSVKARTTEKPARTVKNDPVEDLTDTHKQFPNRSTLPKSSDTSTPVTSSDAVTLATTHNQPSNRRQSIRRQSQTNKPKSQKVETLDIPSDERVGHVKNKQNDEETYSGYTSKKPSISQQSQIPPKTRLNNDNSELEQTDQQNNQRRKSQSLNTTKQYSNEKESKLDRKKSFAKINNAPTFEEPQIHTKDTPGSNAKRKEDTLIQETTSDAQQDNKKLTFGKPISKNAQIINSLQDTIEDYPATENDNEFEEKRDEIDRLAHEIQARKDEIRRLGNEHRQKLKDWADEESEREAMEESRRKEFEALEKERREKEEALLERQRKELNRLEKDLDRKRKALQDASERLHEEQERRDKEIAEKTKELEELKEKLAEDASSAGSGNSYEIKQIEKEMNDIDKQMEDMETKARTARREMELASKKIDSEKRKWESEKLKREAERRARDEEENRLREEAERRRAEHERRMQEEKDKMEEERRRFDSEQARWEAEQRRLAEEEEKRRAEEEEAIRRARMENQIPHLLIEDAMLGEKDQLLKELQRLKQERADMDKQREDLVKRARQLQVKAANKRNQARDLWKKRYYDEKKKTAPQETQVNALREELENLHRKIVNTLENNIKEQRNVKGSGPSEELNIANIRLQAVKYQQEIEELQRRVDDGKMKLTAEIKLRTQAEAELRATRADLTQKKISLSLTRSGQLSAAIMG